MSKQPTASPLCFAITADPQAVATLLDRIRAVVEEALLRHMAKLRASTIIDGLSIEIIDGMVTV
jgi:hypothetical protein